MIELRPTVLEGRGVRLEPLKDEHHQELAATASDGRLWELWYTAVAAPDGMRAHVTDALKGQEAGHMLPWVVRDLAGAAIVGSTRHHDVVPAIDRVEIRHHGLRRDGSVRDTVMYSILAAELPDVRRHLALRLDRRTPTE